MLNGQTEKLALQRRIATDMRDIWAMQPRFERRTGKSPYKLLEHPRFRAGYDFLLLRCESGELDRKWANGGPRSWKPTGLARGTAGPQAARGRRAVGRAEEARPPPPSEERSRGWRQRRMSAISAFVGLGANLGDARAKVRRRCRPRRPARHPRSRALQPVSQRAGGRRRRRLHERGSPYRDQAARRRTVGDAEAIELAHGRERPDHNAPRTLDLDLLLYGTHWRTHR